MEIVIVETYLHKAKLYPNLQSKVLESADYLVDREVWTKVQDILYDCILNPLVLTIRD